MGLAQSTISPQAHTATWQVLNARKSQMLQELLASMSDRPDAQAFVKDVAARVLDAKDVLSALVDRLVPENEPVRQVA